MLTLAIKIARLASVALVMGILVSIPTFALSPDQSLIELTEAADVVLTGQVAEMWSERTSDNMIYTYVVISPDSSLKGDVTGKVVVRVLGGEVSDLGLWVSDAPAFEQGERSLLFLKGEPPYEVVNQQRGKYDIKGTLLSNGRELAEVERLVATIVAGNASIASLYGQDLSMRGGGMRSEGNLAYIWQGHHWPQPEPMNELFFVYENTPDLTGEADAIIAAMQTWSAVDCADFRFTYGGSAARAVPLQDGFNLVRWNHLGVGMSPGRAYTWYNPSDMTIFEADIELNDDWDWSKDPTPPFGKIDIQNVVTHELGHALGLRDVYDPAYGESTMYGYSSWSETKKRTLDPDDIAGLINIYPGPCPQSPPPISPVDCWATPGVWQTFTTVYHDELGWQNIRYADFLVNTSADPVKGVYTRYDVQQNLMFLRNPTDTGWKPVAGKPPGSEGIVKHIYGQLDIGQSSVVTTTNAITIEWTVLFTWRESGQAHKLYLAQEPVEGRGGEQSSASGSYWQDHGGYVVNRTPNYLIPPTELSPRNDIANVSEPQWFDPAYRDLDREWTLDTLYFLIADSQPSDDAPDSQVPHGVYLKYQHNGGTDNGRLYIWSGVAWLGPYLPYDTSDPVESPNATLITRWSKPIYADFNTIKVLWRLQFKTAFLGAHNLYMRAIDTMSAENGGDTGWKWKGTVDIQ